MVPGRFAILVVGTVTVGACSFSRALPATTDGESSAGDAGVDAKTWLDAPPAAACMTDARYVTRPNDTHRYRVTDKAAFDDVADSCARDGAHLATIDDGDENAYVAGLLDDLLWIGFDDLDTESTFRWVARPTAYTNWNTGEPNDFAGNEDCVQLLPTSQSSAHRWNDDSCSKARAGVCECEPDFIAPPVPACRAMPGGETVNGRLYFARSTAATWSAARADCRAMGADLIVPSDQTENAIVAAPNQLHVKTDAWIGVSRTNSSGGAFTPVVGASPFTNWTDEAPHDGAGRDCVALLVASGRWDNQACTTMHPYVCECDPVPPGP